jgi:hypothetical protein
MNSVKKLPIQYLSLQLQNLEIVQQIIWWRADFRQALVNSTFSRPQ